LIKRSPRDGRKRIDVVLYGASGFVGRQTVQHFARYAGAVRWAVAGRSRDRLRQALEAAGVAGGEVIVADALDTAALNAMAARAKVVLSTAGPFALYGSALVAACVEQRTHYVDITGETPWVRALIDRHHEQAAHDGTRIIPGCGFDSVPSDLGAWLVAHALRRETGKPCAWVKGSHSLRGGLNGGTLATAMNAFEGALSQQLADPFLLNPAGSVPPNAADQADPSVAHHDRDFDAWLAPFVMGQVNTRVVRRSAALAIAEGDDAFARDFAYQEYLRVGRGPLAGMAATALALGMAVGQTSLQFGPWRSALRALLPRPGEGPSTKTMDGGSFRCELIGANAAGDRRRGCIAGQGDPGNRATTVLVCEAALALAGDPRRLPGGAAHGGVLTPATGLGKVLAKRLAAAGMTVEPLFD
jgi:short subunit dehydrogenase-like uncharacterized protein